LSRKETLPGIRARSRPWGPVVLFWLSTIAVNASTVAVLAVLSRHQLEGGLPALSAVLGLSLVIAVAPGALQLRAAANVAEGRPAPRPPWQLFGPLSVALLLLAPFVAWAVSIPVIAGVLLALQLPPAVALSVCRGELIGSRQFGAAAVNLTVEASVRLVAGIGLGLLWGSIGIAAGLALATVVALAVVWHRHELGAPALGGAVVASGIALASVGLLANLDLLLAPRVLGEAGADRFDAAALAAQGIFIALFAASWIAVPGARARAGTSREALGPVAFTLLLGVLGSILLLPLRPLVGEILARADPAVVILLPLALSKAMAGATAVAVSVTVARDVRGPWAAPLLASVVLVAVAIAVRPGTDLLALLVLAAQALALVLATIRMLADPPPARHDELADANAVGRMASSRRELAGEPQFRARPQAHA
jgi:hypothetical protein